MGSASLVRVDANDVVAKVTLNRPEKKNAMSPEMHAQMVETLGELAESNSIKVLVLTGVDDSFCAGMDLERCFFEPWDDPRDFARINGQAHEFFQALHYFPAITVAKINGWCFGGGIELVGLCDLAIADEAAIFGLSEVNFGTFPGGGTTWAVARNLHRKDAMELMTTGRQFTGAEAKDYGLINRAVPAAELDEATEELVQTLTQKSRHALLAIKEVYDRSVDMRLEEAIAWENAKLFEFAYRARDEWVRSGIHQFRERRYRPGFESFETDNTQ